MSTTAKRNPRITEDEWNAHKPEIHRMYIFENRTLKEVRDELERRGFSVSKHQLEYRCKGKWKFDKNLSAKDWATIRKTFQETAHETAQVIQETDQEAQETDQETAQGNPYRQLEVYHRGQWVNSDKIKKETRRLRKSSSRQARGRSLQILFHPKKTSLSPFDVWIQHLDRRLQSTSANLIDASKAIGITDLQNFIRFLRQPSFHNLEDDIALRMLYGITQALSSILPRMPRDNIPMVFGVALEATVRKVLDFLLNARFEWTTDEESAFGFGLFCSTFELCQCLDVPKLEAELMLSSIATGHLEACSFLLNRMKTNWVSNTDEAYMYLDARAFHRLVYWQGRSRHHVLRQLMQVLPSRYAFELLTTIIRTGQVEDSKDYLRTLEWSLLESGRRTTASTVESTMPFHTPLDVRFEVQESILNECVALKPEKRAMEMTGVVLDEYYQREAMATARSLGADALVMAARSGHRDVYDFVQTSLNLDPLKITSGGFSGLHGVSMCGDVDFLCYLLDQHHLSDSTEATNAYLSAFYLAFSRFHLQVCNVLETRLHEVSPNGIDWVASLCSCHGTKKPQISDGPSPEDSWNVGRRVFFQSICTLCHNTWHACRTRNYELLFFCLEHSSDPQMERKANSQQERCIGRNTYQLLDAITHGKCCVTGEFERGVPQDFQGSVLCVQELLSRGLCVKGGEVVDALRSSNSELAEVLISAGKATDDRDPSSRGVSWLEAAIHGGDRTCIEIARRRGVDTYDSKALCAAASIIPEHPSVATENILQLLDKRPASQQVDIFEATAVGLAAFHADTTSLRRLLQDINSPSMQCAGSSLLHDGLIRKDRKRSVLLDIDDDFFNEDSSHWFWVYGSRQKCSPVVFGVFSRSIEVVRILVSSGLQPDGLSISMAALSGQQDMLSLVLKHQPDLGQWKLMPGLKARPPLVYAAENEDIEAVAQLLSAGFDINECGPAYHREWLTYTPLQVAAATGNVHLVSFLLEQGANVNAPAGECGATAIQHAFRFGRADVAEILIRHGASLDELPTCDYALPCLGGAMTGGHLELLEILLKHRVAVTGPHRVHYIWAVVGAESPIMAQHLIEYGGWDDTDEDVAQMMKVFLGQTDMTEDLREIAQEFGWDREKDSADHVRDLEATLQLQAKWEAIWEARNSHNTLVGASDGETMVVTTSNITETTLESNLSEGEVLLLDDGTSAMLPPLSPSRVFSPSYGKDPESSNDPLLVLEGDDIDWNYFFRFPNEPEQVPGSMDGDGEEDLRDANPLLGLTPLTEAEMDSGD